MKLFLVSRWGNPHEEDGPDGKDTNLLIAAIDVPDAGVIADKIFGSLPTESDCGGRDVAAFAHSIIEIGSATNDISQGCLIHGPWIENMLTHAVPIHRNWIREDAREPWSQLGADVQN